MFNSVTKNTFPRVNLLHAAMLTAMIISSPIPIAYAAANNASAELQINIAAQPLADALNELARQTGKQLLVKPELLSNKTAPAIKDKLTPEEALKNLLQGSGLEAVIKNDAINIQVAAPAVNEAETLSEVLVKDVADPLNRGLPEAYAGGQVATGARMGVLGNRDIMETPFNVTSYTAQGLADVQATKLAEIVKFDPSVQVVASGQTYSEDLQIRGFRVTQSSIAFDGMSGISPNYGVGSLQAIERVEVFKGANALLNGNTTGLTAGGYVNLVPKRATDTPVNQLNFGYATQSTWRGHGDFGRRFGEDGAFGVRINAAAQDGDGAFENSGEKRQLVAAAFDYRGETLRTFLDLGYQNQDTRGAPLTIYPVSGLPVLSAPSNHTNFAQRWEFSDTQTLYGHTRTELDVAPGVTLYAAYGGHRSRYEQLGSFANQTDATGNFDQSFYNGGGQVNVRTVQGGINADFDTFGITHKLNLSGTRTKSNYHFFYVSDAANGGIDAISSNIYDPTRLSKPTNLYYRPYDDIKPSLVERFTSFAVADTLGVFDDKVQLTLGLRRQRIDTTRYDYNGLGTITGSYDKSAYTPVIALLYKISGAISVYTNYIQSLDAGPTPPDNAVNHDAVFPPTKNEQHEVGVKFDFGNFGLSTDVFEITQPSGLLNPTNLIYSVNGKQRNRGLEVNVFGSLTPKIRLYGGFALLDAKLVKTDSGLYDGNRAPGIAKLNVAGSAEWDFVPDWTLTGGVRHTGATYVDQLNTQHVSDFTIFDLGVRYNAASIMHGLTVRAGVTNIANKAYFISDSFGGYFQGTPRQALLTATLDF